VAPCHDSFENPQITTSDLKPPSVVMIRITIDRAVASCRRALTHSFEIPQITTLRPQTLPLSQLYCKSSFLLQKNSVLQVGTLEMRQF